MFRRFAGAACVALLAAGGDDGLSCPGGGQCDVPPDDEFAALQMGSSRRCRPHDREIKERIVIHDNKLWTKDCRDKWQEVVALGGNYVVKAQPYFPPPHVVRRNARMMRSGAEKMSYTPSDGRRVVPIVRLGAMMEGAMPNGPDIDRDWEKRLEETVEIFKEEGVYVVLDIHQDAVFSSNGGEGFPVWMAAHMQEHQNLSYITSPEHPLVSSIAGTPIETILQSIGVTFPEPIIVNGTEPWLPFSVGGKSGDPRAMNVGNINMRANNNDTAWSIGTLSVTAQVQNCAQRLYTCHRSEEHDREKLFEPFVEFVKHLTEVWEEHENVLAVEMINEPPLPGLPDLGAAALGRRELFDFYAAVMKEFEDSPAIFAFEDIMGSVPGASVMEVAKNPITHEPFFKYEPISDDAWMVMEKRAKQGRIMFSFHWYQGFATVLGFDEQIAAAKASAYGKIMPVFLSEYYDETAQESADRLSTASEAGVPAVTYWHFVDTEFTENAGWYKYPPQIQQAGGWRGDWDAYVQTVLDGTYWGAEITGANGGKMGVLEKV